MAKCAARLVYGPIKATISADCLAIKRTGSALTVMSLKVLRFSLDHVKVIQSVDSTIRKPNRFRKVRSFRRAVLPGRAVSLNSRTVMQCACLMLLSTVRTMNNSASTCAAAL